MENISPTAIVAADDLEDLDLWSEDFPFADDPLDFSGYSGANDYVIPCFFFLCEFPFQK